MIVLSHVPRGAQIPPHRRGEQAAAILETALTLPILIVTILAFVDLGTAVFQTSQSSSAAADGARAGILRFAGADVTGSSDRLAIEKAVKSKLVGQKVDSITVACIDSSDATVECAEADPETDRLRVEVAWTFRPISPLGNMIPTKLLTGRATMGLIDVPFGLSDSTTTTTTEPPTTTTSTSTSTTTTTAPVGCVITGLSSSPTTTSVRANGKLTHNLNLTLDTNGNSACTLMTVRIVTDGVNEEVVAFNKISSTRWTATVDKNGFRWTTGAKVGKAYTGPVALTTHPLVTLT